MKIYRVLFNQEEDLGVFGISVVDMPAMETQKFIALNKHNTNLQCAEIDRKEYTLLGVILTPDKAIFRKDPKTGEEFYITFPEETIRDASHMFIQNGYQKNSTLEHNQKIEGVSIVESWIVKDPANDTANAYGLEVKKGQWVGKMKCDNKEIYDKALKGEVNGFSIDGMFNLKEINLKSDKMDLTKITDAIKEGFSTVLKAQKPDEAEKQVALLLTAISDAKTPEDLDKVTEGLEADVVEKIATEYDAKKIELAEAIEEAKINTLVTELTAEFSDKVDAMKLEMSKEIDKLKGEVDLKTVELAKVEADKKALEIKLAESKRVKLTPKVNDIPYDQMTNYEKLLYNRQNK